MSFDAVIIGAGIVGAACAYELSRAGLRVAVVEERGVGAGATHAGMGHLVLMDDSTPEYALTRLSLDLWRALVPDLPSDCEYRRCGTLWVAATEAELEHAARNPAPRERMSPAELAAIEPNLRPGLAGALFAPDDMAISPPAAARFLLTQSGATLSTTRAISLDDDGLTLADHSCLTAAAIINAAGTAAPQLTPALPIRARKGHIAVAQPGPEFARHQIVELGYLTSAHADALADSVASNVRQNRNGELLIGSSRQYNATTAEPEPAILNRMLARAAAFLPALARTPITRTWTGFRAGTPDGLPLIGLCPGFTRVYAATGHEGLGATTSLATARLLADLLLHRPPAIDPTPYNPARFS